MISQKRISIYTQLANKYNIPYQVVKPKKKYGKEIEQTS